MLGVLLAIFFVGRHQKKFSRSSDPLPTKTKYEENMEEITRRNFLIVITEVDEHGLDLSCIALRTNRDFGIAPVTGAFSGGLGAAGSNSRSGLAILVRCVGVAGRLFPLLLKETCS